MYFFFPTATYLPVSRWHCCDWYFHCLGIFLSHNAWRVSEFLPYLSTLAAVHQFLHLQLRATWPLPIMLQCSWPGKSKEWSKNETIPLWKSKTDWNGQVQFSLVKTVKPSLMRFCTTLVLVGEFFLLSSSFWSNRKCNQSLNNHGKSYEFKVFKEPMQIKFGRWLV